MVRLMLTGIVSTSDIAEASLRCSNLDRALQLALLEGDSAKVQDAIVGIRKEYNNSVWSGEEGLKGYIETRLESILERLPEMSRSALAISPTDSVMGAAETLTKLMFCVALPKSIDLLRNDNESRRFLLESTGQNHTCPIQLFLTHIWEGTSDVLGLTSIVYSVLREKR